MDLELKEFEEKINNITEQFMSLLDSDKSIESSVGNKFENTVTTCNNCTNSDSAVYNNISGPTIFNTGTSISASCTSGSVSCVGGSVNSTSGSVFELKTDGINIGGIAYGNQEFAQVDVPKHAVRFDSVEQMELNKKLEGLYDSKKSVTTNIYDEKPTIAFSDSNIGRINSVGINNTYEDYTKEKTDSTLNNKEVYEMSNYYGNGSNGEGTGENVFYSFATIPTDKSLVEKRSWKDTLFMDIPWDTKIDIWGGIKKFCTAQIKITF